MPEKILNLKGRTIVMGRQGKGWMIFLVLIMLGSSFSGCAALNKNSVSDVEGLLVKAGFNKMAADTPKKLAHLKSLPQHKLITQERDGRKRVLYADAAFCACLYVGNETQLNHYRRLEIQQGENQLELLSQPDIVTGTEFSNIWGKSK
jgi:hypothetical protein